MRDVRSSAFEVVFVCTGNRARSPLAEALLRRRVAAASVRVRSVGTLDVGPAPPLSGALRAGLLGGVDMSQHRARPLRASELKGADLVVGFEPGHISAAVIDGRADVARTFSLVELGELLEGLRGVEPPAPSRPDAVIALAHARRAGRAGSFLSVPTLADPSGGSDDVFERTLDVIDRHVATIAEVIFGIAPA